MRNLTGSFLHTDVGPGFGTTFLASYFTFVLADMAHRVGERNPFDNSSNYHLYQVEDERFDYGER